MRNATEYPFRVKVIWAAGVTEVGVGPLARLVVLSMVTRLALENTGKSERLTSTLRGAPGRLVADGRADGTITLPFGGFGPVIGQTADGLSLAVWLCCGLGLRR